MASSRLKTLHLFTYISLCSCIEWNGPASTAAVEHGSTGIARVPKQAIYRRQTSALSICGYESGQAQSTIACHAGSTCGVSAVPVLPGSSLVRDCCATTLSSGTASCLFYTSCVDFPATVNSNPDILTCTQNAPYCQSFTYPEVDAIGYRCDSTSDTTWRTISLTPSPTTPPNGTLTPTSSISSQSRSPAPAESTPPSGASPSIQDLTPAQRAGIGAGCSCAFLFITFCIFLRIRRQMQKSNDPPPAVFDEKKSPADQVTATLYENPQADQVVEVQGQEPLIEEINSQ